MSYEDEAPKCLYCTDGHYVYNATVGEYEWLECHFCGHRIPKGWMN
jgi:hypothetical protein